MTTADWISMGIAFLSEGGYHHHVAINTLYSLNGEVHRDGVTGLKNFTIIVSDASFYNSIKSNIINNPTSGRKIVQNRGIDKFAITDPDGIQIIIIRTK
jgi:catechol-2,3-dioxygenase